RFDSTDGLKIPPGRTHPQVWQGAQQTPIIKQVPRVSGYRKRNECQVAGGCIRVFARLGKPRRKPKLANPRRRGSKRIVPEIPGCTYKNANAPVAGPKERGLQTNPGTGSRLKAERAAIRTTYCNRASESASLAGLSRAVRAAPTTIRRTSNPSSVTAQAVAMAAMASQRCARV